MEDFHCTNSEDMYYNELKRSMRYFKETKEGTDKMSTIMEELRVEGREEGKAESLLQSVEQIMKNLSVDLAEACRILGISLEVYEKAKELCE